MRHRIALAALVTGLLTAAGGLTACGGGGDGAAPEPKGTILVPGRPGEPNRTEVRGPIKPKPVTEAEVRFAQMMIPHHEQALAMSSLAPGQAADGRVKAIASRIEAEQTVEISAMQAWLRGKTPKPAHGGHGGHGRATAGPQQHAGMAGMATPQQMEQLRAARGEAFDALFLDLMIKHHEGALVMVKDVISKGEDVTIQQLARDVQSGQNAEIARMRALQRG
ncbi:DUF305 domain-containing protein [Actinomadura flavalba]|uniref:DUF305 domain-containing protein n=1 Tax=Actinomadura flavalba TaxID=1120938 RepID=UPI00035DE27D|nr:DUF305 domain-containing protein [Actinomadura flavalba]